MTSDIPPVIDDSATMVPAEPEPNRRNNEANTRIAIIGAGFAGLGMAVRLRQAGFEDFMILERADDVGGTWPDNSYPGCRVDIQSHLYSYSFAPNPDWTEVYASQREIWAYIKSIADRHGVVPNVRTGHEVLSGGHTSALLYAEAQIEYVIRCLQHLDHAGSSSVEVRSDVQSRYNHDLREHLKKTAWMTGECTSWYLDANGDGSALWPGHTRRFRNALRVFYPDDHELGYIDEPLDRSKRSGMHRAGSSIDVVV